MNEPQGTRHALLDLIGRCYKTALDKGWYDKGEPGIPERLALMHSELSEALEHYRNDTVETFFHDPKGSEAPKPDGYYVELADVVIRIFDHVGRHHASVAFVDALEAKMAYNNSRAYRHGGKVC